MLLNLNKLLGLPLVLGALGPCITPVRRPFEKQRVADCSMPHTAPLLFAAFSALLLTAMAVHGTDSEMLRLLQRVAELEAQVAACACDLPTSAPGATAFPNASSFQASVAEQLHKEDIFARAKGFQAADRLGAGPKHITVHCEKDPLVKVTDLPDTERDENTCL